MRTRNLRARILKPLLDHWARFEPDDSEIQIHPADRERLPADRFVASLLPHPYCGDLRRAVAFVAFLNPGHDPQVSPFERLPNIRSRLIANLRQDHDGLEYPFYFLDPAFEGHTGAAWWWGSPVRFARDGKPRPQQRKLRSVGEELARRAGIPLDEARRVVAQRVACIELVPYRSRAWKGGSLANTLPSAQLARKTLHALIDNALIVIPRSIRAWGFEGATRAKNLVVYDAGQGRNASLSMKSPGGREIVKRLLRTI